MNTLLLLLPIVHRSSPLGRTTPLLDPSSTYADVFPFCDARSSSVP
jgi:hypothetical protein